MNVSVERIVELCEILGSYAERLEELRCSPSEANAEIAGSSASESLWGGTVGAARGAPKGPRRWYHALNPHYEELDRIIRAASRSLYDRVFSDARVLAVESSLHRLRAAYEHDKEVAQAQAILDTGDGCSRLAHLVEQESYWALGPELRRALFGSRDILVAGSGPLPLSALSIASALDARVTCIEQDSEGFGVGKRLIEASGHGYAVSSIEADIVDLQRLDGYDAILGVVLLGVDVRDQCDSRKSDIVEHVLDRIRPGASFIFREPHGLGRLLYPPVELNATSEIEVARWAPSVGPEHPYRSALVVARRLGPEPRHAHRSTLRIHS